MLTNTLLGLPMMVLCLLFQSLLFGAAIHYYTRHQYLVNSPSYTASLIVINVVMLLLVVGNRKYAEIWCGNISET